jgi:superfamily I DNA/RNA helicase
MEPSQEQKEIINLISSGTSVICDAVAGSGKTTTVLFIAQQNPGKLIWQITYNKDLKFEVRNRADKQQLTNLTVHTYHSLAYNAYDGSGCKDDGIKKIVNCNTQLKINCCFDILIIDEAQDMTELYYTLINKFIADVYKLSGKKITLLVLGDEYQCIYKFKKSDSRYLTLGLLIYENISALQCSDIQKKHLTTSYRLTRNIANFVNTFVLEKQNYIRAIKDGPKVKYIYDNSMDNTTYILLAEIIKLLKSGLYKYDDIFILGASVSSNSSPISKLENLLVAMNIPCYKTSSMDDYDTNIFNIS